MNLIKFPVGTTNIFPLANSGAGGQLLTEWNIRSRESVGTHSDVKYNIGLSYTHSKDDFELCQEVDGVGVPISSSEIMISPGKAVVNGHFIQSLVPVTIDILEQNVWLQEHDQSPLVGRIGVGLKAFYSTETTMAGAMTVEDNNMYTGIQVVMLPADQLTTPNENITTQTTEGSATCDLKLGTFEFTNGAIRNIRPNDARVQFIDGDKISNIDNVLSDTYISKAGLNPRNLYVFSGKSSDPSLDTWCVANDSLMVWDKNTPAPNKDAVHSDAIGARFVQSTDQQLLNLVVPHKQIDGLKDGQGRDLFFPDKIISLPSASYADSTAGVVSRTYTNNIKKISSKLANFYQLVKGKQVYYLDSLTSVDELPRINSTWRVGDYVLVKEDSTQESTLDTLGAPSTLYAIVPGYVQSIVFYDAVTDSDEIPTGLEGVELEDVDIGESIPINLIENFTESTSEGYKLHAPVVGDVTVVAGSSTDTLTAGSGFNRLTGEITDLATLEHIASNSPTASYSYYELTSDLFSNFSSFRGIPFQDYFVATRTYTEDDVTHYTKYYFVVATAYPKEWSGAIQLTGAVPYAQEDTIGGFLNVPEDTDYTDGGYVYLDDNGHLRLRDYSLLRSGTLAYQLGEDIPEFGSGETLSSIQETLDEFINDRIAFPSATQIKTSSTPNVIEVTINLSDDEPETDDDDGYRHIYIRNIDSRFSTAVYFHFTGDATNKTIINFVDCEKIRIDSNVCGSVLGNRDSYPVINVYRCGLYYDAAVMNYIKTSQPAISEYSYYDFTSDAVITETYPAGFTGMDNIKLWYQRYNNEDPNLSIDDMTVRELDVAIEAENIDFWTYLAPNDNHFAAALSSLTFAGDGTIIGCGLLVASNSTENVTQNDTIIVGDFTLPEGQGLTYPESCMTRQLKVTGTFTTAYNTNTSAGWYVTETAFTALTNAYGSSSSAGSIVLHEKTSIIPSTLTSIPAWETGTYNLFYGGIVSADS